MAFVAAEGFNYDKLEGFIDYTSEEAWKGYIERDILPLWRSAKILDEYIDYLKTSFDGVTLDRLAQEDLPVFLGGVIPETGEYKRNSLAKFYRELFGLKLEGDLGAWAKTSGSTLKQPKVVSEENGVTNFIKSVFKWVNRAIANQTLVRGFDEPKPNYEELKRDPNKLKERVEDFYSSVLRVVANHNYYTFFLYSIRQLPYGYMRVAYPRIDQASDFLKNEFGLTRFNWEPPFKPDSDLYRDYTIWCWPEYNATIPDSNYKETYRSNPEEASKFSFGGSISALNQTIWKHFMKGSKLEGVFRDYFGDFPYLKEEYMGQIKNLSFNFEKVSVRIKSEDGATAKMFYRSPNGIERNDNRNLTILEALSEVLPYLFAGLTDITWVDKSVPLHIYLKPPV